ncbi:MAG: hypothetical protein WC915_03575 [archaeon]
MNKILAILAFLLMLSTAFAVSVNGENTIELCQCTTEKPIYEVCADVAGTYTISTSGTASKWISLAPKTLSLAAGECTNVYVFVTPECYATAGTFPVTLNVIGPENATKNINVVVNQCHTFDYTVTPVTNTSKACESNYFNIYVKNTGKFADEFVLMQSGLNDSWVKYPRESFVIGQGEVLNTVLEVKTDCTTKSGNYNFVLDLANTKTNASASKNLLQTIVNFTPLTTNLSTNINVCSEIGQDVNVAITNVSNMTDQISLSITNVDYLSFDKANLTIDANKTEYITLHILPTAPRDTNFVFSAYSKNYDKSISVNADLKIADCYNVDIVRKETQTSYCVGDNTQNYIVKNNGTKVLNVTVSATGINAADKNVIISPGSEKEVALTFSTNSGDKNVVVTANAEYTTDSVSYNLGFENCFDSELLVQNVEVCAGTNTTRTITLKNNGTKEQSFAVSTDATWVNITDAQVTLAPNTSKDILLNLNVPSTVNSNYTVTAKSINTEINRDLSVQLLSNDVCYGFDVNKASVPIDVNCCSGEIVQIDITNRGQFTQTLNLAKIAPPWVSFSHEQITLDSGETMPVYVYFSPPAGTSGTVIAQIKISNQKGITKTYDFNLVVFGGNCGLGLDAGVAVDNDVTLTKIFTRKEIDVEFYVKNDANVGFNVTGIDINEYPDTEVVFENGVFLSPGESTKARATFSFLENQEPQDKTLNINVHTSVGDFTKVQNVSFTDSNAPVYNEVAITGFFTQFAAPIAGVLLLILILVIIVVVAGKETKSRTKKK